IWRLLGLPIRPDGVANSQRKLAASGRNRQQRPLTVRRPAAGAVQQHLNGRPVGSLARSASRARRRAAPHRPDDRARRVVLGAVRRRPWPDRLAALAGLLRVRARGGLVAPPALGPPPPA